MFKRIRQMGLFLLMTSAETLESYLLIFWGVFNKYSLVIIKYSK